MHIVLPKYFNWEKELSVLSLVNRQLMYVHTFFIAFAVLLMGLFCISSSSEIIQTALGRQVAMGLSVFWFTRLLFQFLVYSPKLWKGRRFETTMHILFSCLWTYFTVVFFLVYLG